MMLFLLSIMTCGCKKIIEVDSPGNQLTSDKVYGDSVSAYAVLSNVYSAFNETIESNLSKNLSLYTDELDLTRQSDEDLQFKNSSVAVDNNGNLAIWKNLYFVIYQCNDLIAQIPNSTSLSNYTTVRLINEAKFLRAFSYFYLLNLYGYVPLILSTDVNANRVAFQAEPEKVYIQILKDLNEAKETLSTEYPTSGKFRANKWAVYALLSRVYLMKNDWNAAEQIAGTVIQKGNYSPIDKVSDVFKPENRESILQFNTFGGFVNSSTSLIPTSDSEIPSYPISQQLFNSFDDGDMRKKDWVGLNTITSNNNVTLYPFSYKYKNRTQSGSRENLVALRLTEQYLIRAEARVMLGKLVGSESGAEDLNVVRNRAGLRNTSATTKNELLSAIEKERKVEFFLEWGARFFDLKRFGKLNEEMKIIKPFWSQKAEYLPIPQTELTYNHNLAQNPGYN